MEKQKLNYKYTDTPYVCYKGNPHEWFQDLKFRICLGPMNKKTLLKTRTKVIREVAKLFAKYGIDTETFNIENNYI